MKVRDIMVPTVDSIDASDTIAYAAARMAEDDIGAFPVLSSGKLVGIVTDRDVAVRAIARAIPVDDPVARIMTKSVETCSPDDDVESVLALMAREQVRRLPVCDLTQDVIGIISVTDAARFDSLKKVVAETLGDICEPSGLHCQAPVFA